MKCFRTSKSDDGSVVRRVESCTVPSREADEVLIQIEWSSLNYKDALAATGHPGVARHLPLVPGIDAAGRVVEAGQSQLQAGDPVLIAHPMFGTERDGGYQQQVAVPADWVIPLPRGLDLRTAMIYGTAGFTAAQSIDQLQFHGVSPGDGEVLVTGATGGVGILSVMMLARLGYTVVAVTGKSDWHDRLRSLGATAVMSREEADDRTDRPLLKGRWAGAIDTVGGNLLATALRGTRPRGCVTACGLVASHELHLTVYPFILRGITLQGIDSAGVSKEYRRRLWNRIATDLRLEGLDELAIETDLEGVSEKIDLILAGQIAGRCIIHIAQ